MAKTILSIVGARPQFVKAAVMSRIFHKNDDFKEVMIHTGQHFDANMSQIFFQELDIPEPAYNLGIGGGLQGQMTGQMLESLEKIMMQEQVDFVLVYGDTNSTLAGALAAIKLHIPVIHIEAGLRSYNRIMPEEINRVLTDHLSKILFCPTKRSVKNLALEGIIDNVHHVGDIMYDAALFAKEKALTTSSILERLDLVAKNYGVCTVHRAESTDNEASFRKIISYLEDYAQKNLLIFPIHPRCRKMIQTYNIKLRNILLIDPIGYFDMQHLLSKASIVFTDSGGLQKEAYFHSVPCVTLRTETEWNETIDAGWNRLWSKPSYKNTRCQIHDYGTGNAAEAIVTIIQDYA